MEVGSVRMTSRFVVFSGAGDDNVHIDDHDAGPESSGQTSDDRDRAAANRDETSDVRDTAADARDNRAEARDRAAANRDETSDAGDNRAEARDRAVGKLDAGAASDRKRALGDRKRALGDRWGAASDREAASSDRVVAAGERVVSAIDGLTRAHRRDAGIVELERDLARAKRARQPFVLAFVDVDGLKTTNDSLGHAAGDQLLRQIVDTIRAHLRSYDLIVRFGGDEFVCGLLDPTMEAVADRFSLVNAELAATQQASVSVGLAELEPDDSLADLIARSDDALYANRRQRRSALG
jgi:diguanylate cyclase (GGDEF)-like protein